MPQETFYMNKRIFTFLTCIVSVTLLTLTTLHFSQNTKQMVSIRNVHHFSKTKTMVPVSSTQYFPSTTKRYVPKPRRTIQHFSITTKRYVPKPRRTTQQLTRTEKGQIPRPELLTHDPVCQNLRNQAPMKEWTFDDTRSLPKKEDMCLMTAQQLESLLHRYMSSIQMLCLHMSRIGNLHDGGWEICHNKGLIQANSCLVYSFGIGYDFSFDDGMQQRFGCEVHSFDPSMGNKSYTHAPSVYFHAKGLASFDYTTSDRKSWKMRTLNTIRKELNHIQRNIDVVKIDIEAWEWLALPEMVESSALSNIKQLVLEFHFPDKIESKTQIYWINKLSIIKLLYDKNYRIFWIHKNPYCFYKSRFTNKKLTACYEVSYLRV